MKILTVRTALWFTWMPMEGRQESTRVVSRMDNFMVMVMKSTKQSTPTQATTQEDRSMAKEFRLIINLSLVRKPS
jgi:hypothetical protein